MNAPAWALGFSCGALVAAPVIGRARRRRGLVRADGLRPERARARAPHAPFGVATRLRSLVEPLLARREAARVDAQLQRELPVAIDLLAVAVGAGHTPYLAVETATRWAPPLIAARLGRVLRSCQLGAGFAAELGALGSGDPRLRPLVEALLASERLGASVVASLAQLAASTRADLRRRAEAQARSVPVRLLFPLVFLVLPAFGLLTVVPTIATRFPG